ncbi:hypothetical protein D3C86_1710100 [compost metagenome]
MPTEISPLASIDGISRKFTRRTTTTTFCASSRICLSSGGNSPNSASSDSPIRNTSRLVDGSKSLARLTAPEMVSIAGCNSLRICNARGVGSRLRPLRTSSGSSNRSRSLASDALTAGWPRNSFSPARVRFFSNIRVSKITSRFMSTRRRSLRFMVMARWGLGSFQ